MADHNNAKDRDGLKSVKQYKPAAFLHGQEDDSTYEGKQITEHAGDILIQTA
jgi:hypothetical protein